MPSELTPTKLKRLLAALGELLESQGISVRILIVGGASLNLAGWIPPRSTDDVDVLASVDPRIDELSEPETLPDAFFEAVRTVARDFGLTDDWLNTEVATQWSTGLPPGAGEGIRWEKFHSLHVGLASRRTMVALKLFAVADRGLDSVHFQDLVALEPSPDELDAARDWVAEQDASPSWPDHVEGVLEDVRRALGRD